MNFLSARKSILISLVFVILYLLPPVVQISGHDYLISLFSRIIIYGLVAISLDLMLGYGGMVSLGHAAFFGIGAYVTAIFSFHSYDASHVLNWPFHLQGSNSIILLLVLSFLIAALFGLLTGAVSLRTRGMHFIMITLAFAQMFYYFFMSMDAYGGADGLILYGRNKLAGIDLGSDVSFYYVCLVLLTVFLFLSHRLVHSRFGLVLKGCRENETKLESLGFGVYLHKLFCYSLAAGIAGLAGSLMANQGEFVSPGLMHWTKSGEILVMVLLGGTGTLIGPLLGAATLTLMEETLAMYTEHWMIFLGPFLILVVLFARNGIYGLLAGARGSIDD